MAASQPKPKLLVIVGPTASGKSNLAFWAAKKLNGEIIAADSRTIYKSLDIGTAKPTQKERAEVPHWGLDLIEPGQAYSAKNFKDYAVTKIAEIQGRNRLPILVGGTGLYIDSVIYDFHFRPTAGKNQRTRLENMSAESLQSIIEENNYPMPNNSRNKRHLIRTIESKGLLGGRRQQLAAGVLLLGLLPPDEILQQNIARRAEKMFESGVVKEVERAIEQYGAPAVAASGIVYKICVQLLTGQISIPEALALFKTADWQYARRQKTWFKRNQDINWFKNAEAAKKFILSRF